MNGLPERVKLALWGWLATVLTSLCFVPALADRSFVIEGAFFSAVLVGVGIGLRAVRAPALAVLAAQVVVLVELMVVRFGDDAKFGLLPTKATLRGIDDVVRAGVDVAQQFEAPAPSSEGLLLMVVFAVCVVAILVDALALGLGRVPLAGLPLLSLYTIPVAALTTGVPFFAFVPGAAAFVAMLMADERDRLAHWGRLVSRNQGGAEQTQIDTSGLSATGRRVSFLALSAAVVLPIFIPSLSASILDGSRGGGEGGPGRLISFKDPMVSLASSLQRKDEADLLRIEGDVTPSYLRLTVLDIPGPNSWGSDAVDLSKTIPINGFLPKPTGLSDEVAERSHSMKITLTDDFPTDSAWLPVPFDLSSVTSGGDFSYVPDDQTAAARSTGAIVDVDTYEVSYSNIQPTEDQLRAAGPPPAEILSRYGGVPTDIPAVVADTAKAVTATADSPYEQAVLLQSFFRGAGNFSYDLDAGYGYGYQAMAAFLDERRGFCQHFSATMAMMARTLGIPSRVVVGFLVAESADGGGYVMTTKNVHAWPELYFEGTGWVRFEPTPGVNAPLPDYADNTISPTFTAPTETGNTDLENQPSLSASVDDTARPDAAGGGNGSGGGPALPSRNWLIGIAVLLLLMLPAALRSAVRRARMTRPIEAAAAAESAWLELRDRVRDLRLPWTGSMTPRAREHALRPYLYDDVDGLAALKRLSLSVERARYATSLAEGARPADDAREVMRVIGANTDRTQRVRAFLWPTSLMPDIRRGWSRLTARLRRATTLRPADHS